MLLPPAHTGPTQGDDEMGKSNFITRYDDTGSKAARFYFSKVADAANFARVFDQEATQSSPDAAGGGLWRVVVPYNGNRADGLPWDEQINAAVQLDSELLAGDATNSQMVAA